MLKAREIRRALESKGFRLENSHHKYYYFFADGKKSAIRTKLSHSSGDLPDGLCAAMARQLQLDRSDFQRLIECSLGHEGYLAILLSKGRL